MIRRWAARVAKVSRSNDGVVAVQMALTLSALLGMAGLATDVGLMLYKQRQMQTVADAAAMSAALAKSTGHPTNFTTEANGVAAQNGYVNATKGVTVTVNSPPVSPPASAADAANTGAVQVIISQPQSPLLAGAVYSGTFNVSAQAVANSTTTVSSCILALNASGAGVSLSGGTTISAPTCAINSQASVAVPCGTYITAKEVDYNGAKPTVGCSGITTAPITNNVKKASTGDPFVGPPPNAGVVAANARAVADASLTSPTLSSVPSGTNVSFGYTQYPPAMPAGCTATGPAYSANWTVTCTAGATHTFGTFTVSGGSVTVNGAATYDFSGTVTNNGSLTFGAGTFNMAQGLVTGGGTTTTFGAGTFNIGGASCSGATYSICHTGSTLTFGGPSTFVLTSGINNGGGSKITFGAGTTNSYNIGESSNGYALNAGGSSITTFADATGSGDVFQAVGDLYNSGGATTTLPAASIHDLNGTVSLVGGVTLGSGLYAIAGNFWLGASGGGGTVSGSNVTFALKGASQKSSLSSPSGSPTPAFYIAAGYNSTTLLAPTTGTYANLVIIGPQSTSVTRGMTLAEGGTANVGGAIYFPDGALSLTGGASLSNTVGQCLQIVATQVTLSGGTTAASTCFSSPGATTMPRLVE